ncbi:ECF RNA polymerase sigma factor SigH [termite gut metagenome]|uniref:ECF RNA polymerase sigma factor SigH n=1 Tax=termite gut metagenome TaxID=433724 RepID=A0A5J4STY1_9ZZZZ
MINGAYNIISFFYFFPCYVCPIVCVLFISMELKQFKTDILPLRDKLICYARKWTDNSADAEDVVQEVMLKLWDIRMKLDEYRSVEALAVTITHNLCMNIGRRKRFELLPIDYVQIETVQTANLEYLIEIKDEYRLIQNIIATLPPLQQAIIHMKDIEEYETDEIAEITGCNHESIRSNLSRARKRVRDIYLQTTQKRQRRNEI